MYILVFNEYNKIDVRNKVRYNIYRGDTMNTINITNARQNLFKIVSDVNVGFNPITIVNNKGKNAVLISEDEWKNIEETLFLSSIPGYKENLYDIKENENWSVAEEYNPDDEW